MGGYKKACHVAPGCTLAPWAGDPAAAAHLEVAQEARIHLFSAAPERLFCSKWVGAGWVYIVLAASVITAQHFQPPTPPPTYFFQCYWAEHQKQALWEHSRSRCAHSAKGSRFGVCAYAEAFGYLWFALYSDCVSSSKPARTPTLLWNGLFTAAVSPFFRSSNCSLARHTGFFFPPVFNLPLNRACLPRLTTSAASVPVSRVLKSVLKYFCGPGG